jgi:hypothetical protein
MQCFNYLTIMFKPNEIEFSPFVDIICGLDTNIPKLQSIIQCHEHIYSVSRIFWVFKFEAA